MTIDKELDTRGLNCPLPILKAKKALTDMQTGQLLRVVPRMPARCATFRRLPSRRATSWSSSSTAGSEFIHVLRRR
jgi:tRNA 2-thiouridine synthesizing protein A